MWNDPCISSYEVKHYFRQNDVMLNDVILLMIMEGRKEGRKEHIYLTKRQCTIHILNNRIVRKLSLRLNKAYSATATEIIIILYRIIIIVGV